jgi:hypothetical protein
MKQETLEEAALRLYPENIESIMDGYHDSNSYQRESFINGYQLAQDKNKYSEEDMKQYACQCVANFLSNSKNELEQSLVQVIINRNNDEFNQFKKK